MSGRRGRRNVGRGFLPGAATLLALVALLIAASAAQARVTLVATGTPELAFLGIPGNEVVARLALPGPARAVAVSRDGARGYVSAGSEIVAVEVNTRSETGRSAIGIGLPEITDIDLSPVGETLYAVRGSQLVVLDPQTFAQRALIDLRGEALQLAVANNGTSAAVTLRSGHVAMVDLGANALLRRVKLKDATGVAIADNGLTYATARGRLRVISRGQRKPRKKAIKLPAGAGGGLTLSPGRSRLVVGAAAGGTSGAIVELRSASVRRIVSGLGPGPRRLVPRREPDRDGRRGSGDDLARQPVLARARRARDAAGHGAERPRRAAGARPHQRRRCGRPAHRHARRRPARRARRR